MPGVKLSANPAGYKPSFGVGTPRRRNLTMDPHRKPVSISSDTLTEIEEGRAAYRQGIANPGKGVPRQQKETGRPDHAFQAKHVEVDMDLSEAGIKALTNKDRIKQQTVRLRQVFETMDSKHDDAIDAEELEQQLLRLGYTPTKYEAADMIWEVDDEGMGKIKWRQFKSVYNRVRMDDLGKEPRRMYNVMEFMVFDIDNDGSIDLTEVMQLFYQRYGKHALFTEQKDARGVRRQASHDITFPEFVKHDETFYTPSRQIQVSRPPMAVAAAGQG
jgi:calmodulin